MANRPNPALTVTADDRKTLARAARRTLIVALVGAAAIYWLIRRL